MNYDISRTNKIFNVIEKQTGHCIKSFETQKKAFEYCCFLNAGGGFDGFTPEFFIKNVKIINSEQ
jgi:hypothetical protein